MNKKKVIGIIIAILIPLVVGGIGALLGGSMQIYEDINRPSFAPPKLVFPIAWTILYILMGIASYIIYKTESKYKKKALAAYVVQLIINMFWTLIFFRFKAYLFAFWWLILLIVAVLVTIYYFYKVDKKASILLIPYILWLLFAAVLNYYVYMLN